MQLTDETIVRRFDATPMQGLSVTDARDRNYRPDELPVTVLTVHVTDVVGGFGVAPFQVARWESAQKSGDVTEELWRQTTYPRELALLERYSRCPYHTIGSRVLGVVHNHPLTRRTVHGNHGNLGPGWALDCGHAEEITPRLRAVGIASLTELCSSMLRQPIERVVIVPHRAWSTSRLNDPGRRVWQSVVLPVVASFGGRVVVGYNTVQGGRPVPNDWDSNALFDSKGRRM